MVCPYTVHFDHQLLGHIQFHRNAEAISMLNENLAKTANSRGETLLRHAAAIGNEVIAKHLIHLGSQVDSLGPGAQTPLMIAVKRGTEEIVRVLLEAGASINVVDADGKSALHMALSSAYIDHKALEAILFRARAETPAMEELVERLLAAECPLPYFVFLRDVDILENLLQRGYGVHSRTSSQRTALHIAALNKDFESAKLLVAQGANVNAIDRDAVHPLFYAAEGADPNMMRFLLDHGANPRANPTYGGHSATQTPLYACYISRENDDEVVRECAELLLERGAYPWRPCSLVQLIQFRDHQIFWNSQLNCLVAHQAMLDASGVPSCEEGEHLTTFVELRKYYGKCREILEVEIVGGMTVCRVLNKSSDRELRLRARDQAFVRQVEQFCAEPKFKETFSYLARMIKKQIAKAVRAVELEKMGMAVVCDLFKCDDNQLSIFARQVVGYLNQRDLEQLCRV